MTSLRSELELLPQRCCVSLLNCVKIFATSQSVSPSLVAKLNHRRRRTAAHKISMVHARKAAHSRSLAYSRTHRSDPTNQRPRRSAPNQTWERNVARAGGDWTKDAIALARSGAISGGARVLRGALRVKNARAWNIGKMLAESIRCCFSAFA